MPNIQYNISKRFVQILYLLSGGGMAFGALVFPLPIFLQTCLFALYVVLCAVALHTRWRLPAWQVALFILCGVIIFMSTLYYLYALPKVMTVLITLLPLPLVIPWFEKITLHFTLPKVSYPFAVILTILIDLWLIIEVLLSQTTDLRPSPWQGLGASFFIMFAISSALIVTLWQREESRVQYVLSALHLFTVLSLTSFMYPLGYGFDAFIHRATEDWIALNGVVLPKQPYYVGQYSIVVWLHHLSNISIFAIDVWLVPVLTSVTLPIVALTIFAKEKWKSLSTILGYLLIPFLSLHLTTPHNLVLFFTFIVVLVSVQKRLPPLLLTMLALAAALIHPLIGIPTLLFSIARLLHQHYHGKRIYILLFAAQSLCMPVLFMLNNIRAGAGAPAIGNPLKTIDSFLNLFAPPYWYEHAAPFHLQMLYLYERLIPFTLITFAIIGLWHNRKKSHYWLYPVTSVGLVVSAWLIRSWIIFPDIVDYEQRDFPLRLIKAAGIFLFPLAIIGTGTIVKKLANRQLFQKIFPFTLGIMLMASLYLTYPQVNAKVKFPGFNVTRADIQAVHSIANTERIGTYIVLSNQLTAAAALREFSFQTYHKTIHGSEHFYYSIPTGGELYSQYLNFLYEGQKREYIESAMDYAQVDVAYVLISDFWKNADSIIATAKGTADSVEEIQGGKITLLRYVR